MQRGQWSEARVYCPHVFIVLGPFLAHLPFTGCSIIVVFWPQEAELELELELELAEESDSGVSIGDNTESRDTPLALENVPDFRQLGISTGKAAEVAYFNSNIPENLSLSLCDIYIIK